MIKNNKFLMIMCVVVCFAFCFSMAGNVLAATGKSDGQNMKKVLHYYGKENYKKARKYNKKISKTAHEACVSNMSKKMKKAYLKVVKRCSTDTPGYPSKKKYLWGYYLTDIDNDKKADLLLKIGTCESDVRLVAYRYRKGKAVKAGSVGAFHTDYYAYPNHHGVLGYGGRMDQFDYNKKWKVEKCKHWKQGSNWEEVVWASLQIKGS